ncbi:LpqB family beta-propeller domain-containing protein [Jonesia quinghaiensis]|uniref:LpqB family beta-propeller domain-containing protein n=1 Tax=Jonesia quinghaiensis TaxID=262806 RepID=UPI00041609C7|nr:LpqB family beta-propeller domain-containing protein [Jonesia quinghaiensis]
MTTDITRRIALAVTLTVAVSLGGCAAIPSQSAVSSADITVQDSGPVFFAAKGPVSDASPQDIVSGFINAQSAGLTDNWSTARQFLTDATADSWSPGATVNVYSGELDLSAARPPQNSDESAPSEDDNATDGGIVDLATATSVTIEAQADLTGTLNDVGAYTESLEGSQSLTTFELVRDAEDQWRISALSDDIFMAEPNFESLYRSTTIYFVSADEEFLVPEVRWFPRTRTETYVVNALLSGPSDWLADSVTNLFPDGTRLVYDAVNVDGGTATVNLSSQVTTATPQDRSLLATQIRSALTRLPGIRNVAIQANSIELQVGDLPELQRDPTLATSPIIVTGTGLSQVTQGAVEPLDPPVDLSPYDVTGLAVNGDRSLQVILDDQDTLRRVSAGQDSGAVLARGDDLIAPSIDRFNWVWTGEVEQGDTSELQVVTGDGTTVPVAIPWLAGRTISEIRVSHDGARIAVISAAPGRRLIEVAAITRDADNVPQAVSEPISVGGGITSPELLEWIDESTLAVITSAQDNGGQGFYSVQVGGTSEYISALENVATLGAGRGLRAVYVGTKDGSILSRAATGAAWVTVVEEGALPTFPG